MVVGDDAQSIYSWRGANYRNIIGFPERYPGTKVFKIEINYRSIPHVLTLANSSIRTNVHQFSKQLRPARSGGRKPWLVPCSDTNEQARFIAQRLVDLREEGVSLSEVAVLYRAHYHSMELQMELTRRNIPYVITSGLRFFEQAHVKDVASFLKVVANPGDELAFKRILRLLQGIGGKTATKLWEQFRPILLEQHQLPSESGIVPKKAKEDWKGLSDTLNMLKSSSTLDTADMIEHVLEGFYVSYLKTKYPNARAREEDLHQLAAFARQFNNLGEFLSQLALMTNIEVDDEAMLGSEEPEFVRLSTVHQAKGLEWHSVFVIGLCEGMFPLARSLENIESEEEERRLFYVAATRAKDELYLTYPTFRLIGGENGGFQRPSRFIGEIPKEHYEEVSLRHSRQY